MLPEEAIQEFRELYLQCYGVELTDAEAAMRANNLVTLYEAVYIDQLKNNDKKTHEIIGKKIPETIR